MEDYTTENKLEIKRWVTVPGIQGMPKVFQEFTDMFAVDYNLLKDELKTQNESSQRSEETILIRTFSE